MYNLKKRGLLFTFLAVMILSKCFSQEVFSKENEVISRKTETVSKEAPLFKDVTKDHWAYKQITSLEDKGIINGYSDGSFKPGENVTRAHAAVMIVNALKLDYVGKVPEFLDVSSKHWAAGHIAAAQEAGIINGYKDGTFKPGDNITRGQISVMVMNAFNLEQKGSHKNFSDVPDTHWAYKHIEVLASNRIINGYRDGSFGPGDLTTRAHFSVILSNAIAKKVLSIDLTKYKAALASVEEDDCTNDSWIIYQEIVKENFVTEKNTQEEVDKATAKIIEAQADLVYKHIPGLDNINTSATVTDESVDVNIKLNWTGKLESLEYIYLDFYNEKTEKNISVYIEKKDMDESGNVDCVRQLSEYFQSGTYKLKYIAIDHADGSYKFYSVEGYPEATIIIQNEKEDVIPPEIDLDSIKVTIEGSKATIDFECVDELSGLSHVEFTFCNEKRESFRITTSDIEIKDIAGGYQISQDISWFSLGTYNLVGIYVCDNVGNENYYDKEDHNLEKHKFEITLDDFKIPGLDNIETSVAYNDDSIDVNIKLDWLGEFEAIDYISFQFYNENREQGIYIDIYKEDMDRNGNTDFLKQLSKYYRSGTYKLGSIGIGYADETHEYYSAYSAKGYPEAVITIQNENEDIHPPEIDLDSIKITKEGRKVTIDFECVEELSGLKDAGFEFYNEERESFIISAFDNEIKETAGGYQISQDISWFSLGTYTLESISVSDNAGNSNFYDKENHNLEKHKFEITLDDLKIPGIEDIETSVAYTDDSIDVNIKLDCLEEYETIDYIYFRFYDENIEQEIFIDICKEDIDENGNIDYIKQLNKHFQSGTYKLDYIDIGYTDGTYEYYSASGYPEAVITIQNENEDVFPPEIDLDSIKVTIEGTKATIDFECLEELSGLKDAGFEFYNEERESFIISSFDNGIKETAGGYQISQDISWFSLGTYTLERISVSDNAGNSNYYDKEDHNLEKHKFEITLDDFKIPGIEDIETSVAYNDDSIDVNIKLDWLGEFEAIDYISFVFYDENREQGIYIREQGIYIDIYKEDMDRNGNADVLKQLSKYYRSGTYKLGRIYIEYADGTYEYYSEKGYPEAVITIQNENEDINPPEIDLDSIKVTIEGTKATIDFECLEELSGLKDAGFEFYNEEREPFTIFAFDNGIKETAGGYQISQDISWFSLGTYTLERISVSDNAGNSNFYDKEDHNLEKHKFVITLDDFKIPGIEDIETSVAYTDDSIDVNIKLDWLGEFETIDHIYFRFYDENIEQEIFIDICKEDIDENGNIDFLKQLSKYFQSGTYKLDYIDIEYTEGTYEHYSVSGYPEAVITIQNENEDIHPPEIDLDSLKITKEGAKAIIDFECVEEKSGLKDISFTFHDGERSYGYEPFTDIKQTSTGYQVSLDVSWLKVGTYSVYSISVSDNAGNLNYYDNANHNFEMLKFEIYGD